LLALRRRIVELYEYSEEWPIYFDVALEGIMHDCDKLEQTVNAFCAYIQSLPDADKEEQTWGPKEILVHLVQFHENFVNQTEAILAKQAYENLKGRFDQVNAQAVRMNRGVSIDKLIQRFQIADQRLRHFAQTCDADGLQVKLKAASKPQSLSSVITMVEHHIRSHHHRLQRGETFTSQEDKLAETIKQFCGFFDGLSDEIQTRHETYFRSTLCPIVFWHENAVSQAEARLYNEPPTLPAGRLSDLNATAITLNQKVSLAELVCRLKTANQKLQDIAELHDPDKLSFEVRKNNGLRTFSRTMSVLETDIRRRLMDLKRFVKRLSKL
jgi:hypothetical protein